MIRVSRIIPSQSVAGCSGASDADVTIIYDVYQEFCIANGGVNHKLSVVFSLPPKVGLV